MAMTSRGEAMFNWLNDHAIGSTAVKYNPEHLIKWKSNPTQPIGGLVFSSITETSPVKGFLVPGSIRRDDEIVNADLSSFKFDSLIPRWYTKPGTSMPVRAFEGHLSTTMERVIYVPEHFILEQPLPDSTDNQYFFVPRHCVHDMNFSTIEQLPMQVNYVPAIRSNFASTNGSGSAVTTTDLNEWLREEIRIGRVCDVRNIDGWGKPSLLDWNISSMLMEFLATSVTAFFLFRWFH